jgi:hypothetical protein
MTQPAADTEPVTPNTALRAVRESMRMSQDELARAVRAAGDQLGEPNGCDKRTVQRWEAGLVAAPRGNYVRALEYITGQPAGNLGFGEAAGRDGAGISRRQAIGAAAAAAAVIPLSEAKAGRAPALGLLTGIWLSRYEYTSSSRGGKVFDGCHHLLLVQRGTRVQARSIAGSAPSRLIMDLTADGAVLTGTWREETDPAGYYAGAVYHGAIQLVTGPSGHRMKGQWTGFGKDGEVNTGPWQLDLVSSDTGRDAMQRYSVPPEPAAGDTR